MRRADGTAGRPTGSRRALLATLAGTTLGAVGTAGCLADGDRVRVLSAGSLASVLENGVGPAFRSETGIGYEGEYHGSNAVVRMVRDGTKRPDVAISADIGLLRDRLRPDYADWDLTFAANEVVIVYASETALGARLADGEPWYEVFADAGPDEIAISDPDLDPLGYRAVLLFELAAREHGLEGFRESMLERVYREPDEAQLLAGLEAGNRACAVAYKNMAVERDLPYRTLPDAYNFGNPDYASQYADASYTTDDGYTTRGSPVVYGATVCTTGDAQAAGREFVDFLASNPSLLTDRGLRVDDSLPRAHGDVPEVLENATARAVSAAEAGSESEAEVFEP
ncbi:extracellular solute-binding protein [Halopiger xanaduensis]|uniref:Extracellular solute-binding protein family 1 n=1 Tax=Halopiger xanaduensis (strain DSM 18323 / JCM 14033 / SH-6) TaxID=797210 RepID=F8D6R8_HALXS|nr:extracellular solute-binding protein [Halopiger xanaduensis]AEH37814.1 extracellular solute-binding protein family 1 [Halopiger xanaduensis SH-6]